MTKSPAENRVDESQVAHDELSDDQLERVAAGIPPDYGVFKGAKGDRNHTQR